MKCFFLIVFAIASVNALNEVPNALIGNWTFLNTTCDLNCIESMNFVQAENSSLNVTATYFNTPKCNNATVLSMETSDVEADESMPSNTVSNFTLPLEDNVYEFSLSNIGSNLTLSVYADCEVTLTRNNGDYLLKAATGIIVAIMFI